MDVKDLLDRVTEPPITALVRAQLERIDARLTPQQRQHTERWNRARPFAAERLNPLRRSIEDPQQLRECAERFRAGGMPLSGAVSARIDEVSRASAHAASKPAVVSALAWLLLASTDEELAAHLIQIIRERAGLPRLTRKLESDDVGLAAAAGNVPALVAWFSDRQVADAGAYLESLPVPHGPDAATLAAQVAAVAAVRTATPRLGAQMFAAFARRAATFLVELSTRKLDPLGFALGREVQLEADPALARRVEVAAWVRRAGHMVSPRGVMLVLSLPVQAPWPWRLELIAAEPGHGASGCLALLLRLASTGAPVSMRAPALLLVPDETDEERGARFERWLAVAYPHATSEWRGWM